MQSTVLIFQMPWQSLVSVAMYGPCSLSRSLALAPSLSLSLEMREIEIVHWRTELHSTDFRIRAMTVRSLWISPEKCEHPCTNARFRVAKPSECCSSANRQQKEEEEDDDEKIHSANRMAFRFWIQHENDCGRSFGWSLKFTLELFWWNGIDREYCAEMWYIFASEEDENENQLYNRIKYKVCIYRMYSIDNTNWSAFISSIVSN